jgi:hypothetical protein
MWLTLTRNHWWPGPVYHARDMYVTQARNLVINEALANQDEWDDLLFWDADQIPPAVIPGPLSWAGTKSGKPWPGGFFTEYIQWIAEEEPAKKIIGGAYPSKEDFWEVTAEGHVVHGPHDPVAYWSPGGEGNLPGAGYHHLAPEQFISMLQRPALYRVHGVGTGSMLIRKEILLKLREIKGGDVFEAPPARGSIGQAPGSQWTEDLYFCDEIQRKLGEWIWLDTAMQSEHLQRRPVSFKHYLEGRGMSTAPHPQSPRARGLQQYLPSQKSRIIVPR